MQIMTKDEYHKMEESCQLAIIGLQTQENHGQWLKDNSTLYQKIPIKSINGKSAPIMLFGDKFFLNIGNFYGQYEALLFEQNILEFMSQEEAILYFIKKLDIYNIDRVLNSKPIQFIDFIKNEFAEKRLNNKWLILYSGKCLLNNPNCNCYRFMGNVDKTIIDIMIEFNKETNSIINIQELQYE